MAILGNSRDELFCMIFRKYAVLYTVIFFFPNTNIFRYSFSLPLSPKYWSYLSSIKTLHPVRSCVTPLFISLCVELWSSVWETHTGRPVFITSSDANSVRLQMASEAFQAIRAAWIMTSALLSPQRQSSHSWGPLAPS